MNVYYREVIRISEGSNKHRQMHINRKYTKHILNARYKLRATGIRDCTTAYGTLEVCSFQSVHTGVGVSQFALETVEKRELNIRFAERHIPITVTTH